jgi:hypothetical protein
VLALDLHAGVSGPDPDQRSKLGSRTTSQVVLLVRDLDNVGADCRDLSQPDENVVGTVAAVPMPSNGRPPGGGLLS